jgi:hypothetical protein
MGALYGSGYLSTGAMLRPGDTSFGAAEVPLIEGWMDRVRHAVGPDCLLYVRIGLDGLRGLLRKMRRSRRAALFHVLT